MERRNPGSGPKPGERVPYVFVLNPKAKKQVDRVDDPNYVRDNKIRLDLSYYLEHQFINPIFSLLELTFDSSTKDPKTKLFGDIIIKARNASRNQREISNFFKPKGL